MDRLLSTNNEVVMVTKRRRRPRSVVPAAALLAIVVFGRDDSSIPAVTHALQGSSSVARQSPLFSTAFQRQKQQRQQAPQSNIWQGGVEDDYPDEDAATAATKKFASPLHWPNNNGSTPISILSRQDLLRELGQTKKDNKEEESSRRQQQDSTQLQGGGSSTTTTPNKSFLVRLGCLFALNAGMLNGLALSGVFLAQKSASVSAVTGTYTHAAVAFSNHGMSRMLAILSTPLLYMMGSLVNGFCNPNGHEDFVVTTTTTRPLYYSLTLIQTAPLLLAGVLVGLASAVATTTTLGSSASLILPFLTMAMGLQNSWTSMLLPGNLLRTAHFSGITSDLGTVLGQTLRQHGKATTSSLASSKISIFGRLLASFWMGGMMSAVGFPLWGVPPGVALVASAMGYLLVWASMTGPIRERIIKTVSKPTGKFLGRLFPKSADMVWRRLHDGAPKNVFQA